jgi:hypothetical protein
MSRLIDWVRANSRLSNYFCRAVTMLRLLLS